MCWHCSIPFIGLQLAHLENSVKIRFLLVSADFVEGQKGENSARFLPRAPLLQKLLFQNKKNQEHHMHSELYRLYKEEPLHSNALEHVAYLNQEATLFWETEVIRCELVGMSQDSADDRGLGQTGQQLFVERDGGDQTE